MRYASSPVLQNHFHLASHSDSLFTDTNIDRMQFMAPTTKSAWKDHVRGLEALINKYGPAMFHQEPMRRAFEQARMHIVCYDLFLSSWLLEWLNIRLYMS